MEKPLKIAVYVSTVVGVLLLISHLYDRYLLSKTYKK